jgi:hypothetical protein
MSRKSSLTVLTQIRFRDSLGIRPLHIDTRQVYHARGKGKEVISYCSFYDKRRQYLSFEVGDGNVQCKPGTKGA